MSTRCRIGLRMQDGSIMSCYCHHDGYPSGVGSELKSNYSSFTKALPLVVQGYWSSIDPKSVNEIMNKTEFERPSRAIPEIHYSEEEYIEEFWKHSDVEYVYLLDRSSRLITSIKKWYCWSVGSWEYENLDEPELVAIPEPLKVKHEL
jgi:hypothetical protein